MSRRARYAPVLSGGQQYVVRYGARPVGHISNPLRAGATVCGVQRAAEPLGEVAGLYMRRLLWGAPSADLGAGVRLCKSCDRMKGADTVRLPDGVSLVSPRVSAPVRAQLGCSFPHCHGPAHFERRHAGGFEYGCAEHVPGRGPR